MDAKKIKAALFNKCLEYVEHQIDNIQQAINAAKESGNDETKSSAGDKHETGRSLMQLEQEKNTKQFREALGLKKFLAKFDPNSGSDKVTQGSLVITDKGNFYISISAGKIIIDDIVYFAVSPLSPIALKFMNAMAGQEFDFNGLKYKIKEIF